MSVTVTPPAVGGAAGGSRTGCATLCDLSRHGSRVLHGALPPTKSHPLPRMWCQPSNGCPRYSTLPVICTRAGHLIRFAPDLSLLRNRRRGSLRRTYPAAICLPQRSADWTDTVTMPCSATEQNSAPLPRFTSESSGPPSDSPDNEGSRSICTCSPRRTSLLPRSGPSFPRRFPDAHAPARVSRNLLTALDAA